MFNAEVRHKYYEKDLKSFEEKRGKIKSFGDKIEMYEFSEIDDKDKFSIGYKDCIGVVAMGYDQNLNKRVSFLCHLPSDAVASYADGQHVVNDHLVYMDVLAKKMDELKLRCSASSISVGILGGNMYDKKGQVHYENGLGNLHQVISISAGIKAHVLHAPAKPQSHRLPFSHRNIFVSTENSEILLEGTDAVEHIGLGGVFELSPDNVRAAVAHVNEVTDAATQYYSRNSTYGGKTYIDVEVVKPLLLYKIHKNKMIKTDAGMSLIKEKVPISHPRYMYYQYLKSKYGTPINHIRLYYDKEGKIWHRRSHPLHPLNQSRAHKVYKAERNSARRKWIRGTDPIAYYYPKSPDSY